jgi:hypothetical protein
LTLSAWVVDDERNGGIISSRAEEISEFLPIIIITARYRGDFQLRVGSRRADAEIERFTRASRAAFQRAESKGTL